jgi:hypothetical protein
MGNKLSHSDDKKAFTAAIKSGDIESIQHIVTSHPEFFESKLQKESGNTPIHVAVLLKDYALLKLFVDFTSTRQVPTNPNLEGILMTSETSSLKILII